MDRHSSSSADVPDNRPLSDGYAARLWPPRVEEFRMGSGGAGWRTAMPAGCGGDELAVTATTRANSDGSRRGRNGHVLGQRQSPAAIPAPGSGDAAVS